MTTDNSRNKRVPAVAKGPSDELIKMLMERFRTATSETQPNRLGTAFFLLQAGLSRMMWAANTDLQKKPKDKALLNHMNFLASLYAAAETLMEKIMERPTPTGKKRS